MKNVTLFNGLLLASGLAAVVPAHAGSVSTTSAPVMVLEVLELDALGAKTSNSWKAVLSSTGATEFTWQSDATWGAGTDLATPGWFSVDPATGAWTMTGNWNWEKTGFFTLDVNQDKVMGNLDPEVGYSMTVANTSGRTLTYAQAVIAPIDPLVTGANRVKARVEGNVNGTLTPAPVLAQDGDGVNELQLFLLSDDAESTWTNAGVDVGTGATVSGAYGGYSEGYTLPVAGPESSWDTMQVRSRFTLSSGGSATISGYAQILPVPEMESYALILAGFGLVGLLARRRG